MSCVKLVWMFFPVFLCLLRSLFIKYPVCYILVSSFLAPRVQHRDRIIHHKRKVAAPLLPRFVFSVLWKVFCLPFSLLRDDGIHRRSQLTEPGVRGKSAAVSGGVPPPPAAHPGLPFAEDLSRHPRLARPAVHGKSAAVRGELKPAGVSAGPAQLIFVSAGPAQLIFAGPAQLIFVAAGSVQFRATRALPGTPGLVSELWGDGLEPSPRACS